jgi:hypothetical protein
MTGRVSGHLRIVRTSLRRGDNAQLVRVSFVDDLSQAPVAKSAAAEAKTAAPTKTAAAKTPAKKAAKAEAKETA